jgi:autotransporter-associated beta strand protein
MKNKLLLIFSIVFSIGFCSNIFAQTDYFWRDNAANGNWDGSANGGHWWSNSAQNTPGFGNIKFNNTNESTMNNNVTNLSTHAIYFLTGSSARTISGNAIQLYDNNSSDPVIKNETSNNQTINIDIKGDGDATDPLLLEAHSGDFIFKKINNNGSPIWVNSDNGKTIKFTDVISGSGAFVNRNNTYSKFSASNTFTGNFYIDEGEVWVEENCTFNNSITFDLGSSSRMGDVAKLLITDLNGGTTLSNNIVVNDGNTDTRYLGGINTSNTNTFSGNISLNRYVNIKSTQLNGTVEFSGVISGSHGIDKIGVGTVIFSGNNTYTGLNTLKAGKLIVNSGGNLGDDADVTIQSGATLELNTNVTVDDLNINSGGTLTLASGVTLTVNGVLALGADINLGSGNIVVNGLISSASSSGYIIADGSGTLKQNVGTSAVEFPVGTSSSYMPIEINTSSGSADFEVRMIGNSYANSASYLDNNWLITSSASQTIDMKFTWPSSEEGTSFPTGNMNLHKDGTALNYNVAKSGTGPYFASYSGVSCCSQFSPGGNPPVPVELTYFDVTPKEKQNLLTWETASELNNHFFEVQRSINGSDFTSIDVVYGNGTTQEISNYSFSDYDIGPYQMSYFYRLMQVDYDGTYSYSPIVVANRKIRTNTHLSANPNPISNEWSLNLSNGFNGDLFVDIFTQEGINIFHEKCQFEEGILILENFDLPDGMFYAKVFIGEQVVVTKVVKK